MRTTFRVEFPLAQMFKSSTLAGMARRVENSTARVTETLLDWDEETALSPSLLHPAASDSQPVVPAIYGKVVV